MSEQEAQAFAARLTRVWQPQQISEAGFDASVFRWFSKLNRDIHLLVQENTGVLWIRLASRVGYLTYDTGHLIERDSLVPRNALGLRREAKFTAEWMPVFRRGCWLSGCPIEASAHEKAEWIRDFTKEEVKTWNLKM